MGSCYDENGYPTVLCDKYNNSCIEYRSYHSYQSSFQLCRFDKKDILQILQEYICERYHKEQ